MIFRRIVSHYVIDAPGERLECLELRMRIGADEPDANRGFDRLIAGRSRFRRSRGAPPTIVMTAPSSVRNSDDRLLCDR
jgi:hypothetical protein